MAKEDLLHDMEAFDNIKQIDDVQISPQLFNAPVQVEVIQAFALQGSNLTPTSEASEVIEQCLACVVAEPALVEDQMEDVEELLSLRLLADQLFALLAQVLEEDLVLFLLFVIGL